MIITIGFSTAKNDLMLFARGIEAIEKRPYSHVFIRYDDPITGIEMVFQASHGMVNHMSYALFLTGNKVIKGYNINYNRVEFNTFYTFTLSRLGAPYGWKSILGIFLSKILRISNPFPNAKLTDICSQLGAQVCALKGMQMPQDMSSVTPSNLDTLIQNAGYKPNNI